MKIPICSKCGSDKIEKIIWTKSVTKCKWDENRNSWDWSPLSNGPSFPITKKARHWCFNCNYYNRIKWIKKV